MKDKGAGNVSLMATIRDSRISTALQDSMAMAYWRTIGKRAGDVFLCSYPKSGRTWFRFMITYYQIRLVGIDYQLNLKTFPELSPKDGAGTR